MYAVQIEIEKGEYTLVRKENPWTYDSEVLTFETKEEAQAELTRWNTGVIVDFNTNRSFDRKYSYNDIRTFDLDERNRAKERSKINNV